MCIRRQDQLQLSVLQLHKAGPAIGPTVAVIAHRSNAKPALTLGYEFSKTDCDASSADMDVASATTMAAITSLPPVSDGYPVDGSGEAGEVEFRFIDY